MGRLYSVHFVRQFKCNVDHTKCSYYRSFNVFTAIFGRISRFVSVETFMYLIKTECLPVLIYGIEAYPTYSINIKTLDHPNTATFMKVFSTKSTDVVCDSQMAFEFRSLNERILTRKINFVQKFINCQNLIF